MILVDTHVFVWIVANNTRIGERARHALLRAAQDAAIGISVITPWEIALLSAKGRLALNEDAERWFQDALARSRIVVVPLQPSIAIQSNFLPNYSRRDPADRIIIATARHTSSVLITADRAILDYGAAGYVKTMPAEE